MPASTRARVLRLDRGAHGGAAALGACSRSCWSAVFDRLRQSRAAYRLADQVPDKRQAVAASERLDKKLEGANPIDILVEFPKGKSLYDPETLQTIGEVHSVVEHEAGVGNVWSLETLRRWLAEKAGKTDVATLKEYVDVIPEHLVRRFIDKEQDAVVVNGRVPDLDFSQILPSSKNSTTRWSRSASATRATRLRSPVCLRSRRATRRDDRKTQSRPDHRISAGRGVHRARLPLGGGDVLEHPARISRW